MPCAVSIDVQVVNDTEFQIGEPISNSFWLRYIHLCVITLRKGINPLNLLSDVGYLVEL